MQRFNAADTHPAATVGDYVSEVILGQVALSLAAATVLAVAVAAPARARRLSSPACSSAYCTGSGGVSFDALPLRDALAALVSAVVGAVLATHALLADRLRRHLHPPVALDRVNRSSALRMVGAAGTIATR